jgi:hypothetical protein
VLWCPKIPDKWSPYSLHVAKGSKVGMREERKAQVEGRLSQFFPLFFRFAFSK